MTEIDAQSLANQLSQPNPPLVIDVRQPQETQLEGMIDGAVLIPMDQLPARLSEVPMGRAVVAVCKSGMRSANSANWLRAQGRDVVSLQGGMIQWKALGLPVKK